MGQRQQKLIDWLCQESKSEQIRLTPLCGGASFRRFFRFNIDDKSYIAMDAPPDQENCALYVSLTEKLAAIALAIPQIFAADTVNGFVWLSDLGDQLYFHYLNQDNVNQLYHAAFKPLLALQQASMDLPAFDYNKLQNRLSGFSHTFIENYLGLTLTQAEKQTVNETYDYLINVVLDQPQVPIHYDYHSQNLLYLDDGTTGIVDFQDAQYGPITYDLASLLRDCYVAWPTIQVRGWVSDYYQQLQQQQLVATTVSLEKFNKWFDLTAMKRHLRASFVFARKWLRDNDSSYLQHLPRTLNYVHNTCQQYQQLTPFQQLVEQKILPALQQKQQEMR